MRHFTQIVRKRFVLLTLLVLFGVALFVGNSSVASAAPCSPPISNNTTTWYPNGCTSAQGIPAGSNIGAGSTGALDTVTSTNGSNFYLWCSDGVHHTKANDYG